MHDKSFLGSSITRHLKFTLNDIFGFEEKNSKIASGRDSFRGITPRLVFSYLNCFPYLGSNSETYVIFVNY